MYTLVAEVQKCMIRIVPGSCARSVVVGDKPLEDTDKWCVRLYVFTNLLVLAAASYN